MATGLQYVITGLEPKAFSWLQAAWSAELDINDKVKHGQHLGCGKQATSYSSHSLKKILPTRIESQLYANCKVIWARGETVGRGANASRGIKVCWQAGPSLISQVMSHAAELALESPCLLSLGKLYNHQFQQQTLCLYLCDLHIAMRVFFLIFELFQV